MNISPKLILPLGIATIALVFAIFQAWPQSVVKTPDLTATTNVDSAEISDSDINAVISSASVEATTDAELSDTEIISSDSTTLNAINDTYVQ